MQKQIEITKPTKLLKDDGSLKQPGYCKRNLFDYNREKITASKLRIKEWDYYQFSNERYVVQMCFANISIGAAASVLVIDKKTGKNVQELRLHALTVNRYKMPSNGDRPYKFTYHKGKNFFFQIDTQEIIRKLKFKGRKIQIDIKMDILPGQESIVMATPFYKPNQFFFTQKLNCMPVTGTMTVNGDKINLKPDNTFCVMDWGRGVWPYKNVWYWGNGSTWINGKLFGFEITWGFGDESNATETAVFYDGKCHKIGAVDIQTDPKGKWMEPWIFKSEDGRFNLTMTPEYDHKVGAKVLVVGARCHQVHGLFNGTVTLDDGTILEIKNMRAFCEKMDNLW